MFKSFSFPVLYNQRMSHYHSSIIPVPSVFMLEIRMFFPCVSLFSVFILPRPTFGCCFQVLIPCTSILFTFTCLSLFKHLFCQTFSSARALSPISSLLAVSFLFSLPTCPTLRSFFLRPSTPLAVTQYFQFTLLLSNLPLHSSGAPFIIWAYRPPPSVLLSLSPRLKDGFKDPFSPLSLSTQ